ncbi:MAG: cytochrome c peroxidase [Pirellulaceae bacterium]
MIMRTACCGQRRVAAVLVAVWLFASTSVAEERSRPPVLPKDTLPKEIDLDAAMKKLKLLGGAPPDNPLTKEQVALGRRLFFDSILSKNRTLSCASCHQPEHGFASPEPKAVGIHGQTGRRNAPALMNRALGIRQFWDGRAATLEEQALQPIVNSQELGHSLEDVIVELRNDSTYVRLFRHAFAEADGTKQTETGGKYITSENLAKALASFQRTLLTGDSPVDLFQRGDYGSLSDDERQGLWIFESRGRCWKCHTGNNYSDEAFHNTGIGYGKEGRDLGRFEVTKRNLDKGKFKTPTLRAVGRTAPYMHDGSLPTLEEVIGFYNQGGTADDPTLDRFIQPLGLSEKEMNQLVAFLRALSR